MFLVNDMHKVLPLLSPQLHAGKTFLLPICFFLSILLAYKIKFCFTHEWYKAAQTTTTKQASERTSKKKNGIKFFGNVGDVLRRGDESTSVCLLLSSSIVICCNLIASRSKHISDVLPIKNIISATYGDYVYRLPSRVCTRRFIFHVRKLSTDTVPEV